MSERRVPEEAVFAKIGRLQLEVDLLREQIADLVAQLAEANTKACKCKKEKDA